ncbi:unnamed protein product [Caenorhabditis bovis]|uniref:Glycolipid transfer protein domain-containing protein n=1 Tax=Caenorhabditis bovis TaxID=2654633 RepID=A0A8S1FDP2_9PELO|nr:unnamed protein product [Caenorhabditis bovis]
MASTSAIVTIADTYQIMEAIENCQTESDDVIVEKYLLFWSHVCRVMSNWGIVFSFVVKDVQMKLEKLQEKLKNDPENYKTILRMAKHEAENGTIRNLKPNRSGTGHILVLKRALEFVIDLLDGVFCAPDPSIRVSTIAKAAYDKHLSQFHSWPIRTCVSGALLSLPRKDEFLIRLRGDMPSKDDNRFHETLTVQGREIIRRQDALVERFNLADYNPSA